MLFLSVHRFYTHGIYQWQRESKHIPSIECLCQCRLLFWRKNNIEDSDQDRNPYHWIIWYLWKIRNDKLFRKIDKDPLELIRHGKTECQACYLMAVTVLITSQPLGNTNSLPICLENIFLVDGSWTPTYLSIQWMWITLEWHLWTNLINRNTEHKTTGVNFAFRNRSSELGDREYVASFNLPEFWDGLHESDHHD